VQSRHKKGDFRPAAVAGSPYFTITDAPESKTGRFAGMVNGSLYLYLKRSGAPLLSKERRTKRVRCF